MADPHWSLQDLIARMKEMVSTVDLKGPELMVDGEKKSQRSGMAVVLCKHGFDPFGLDSSCLAHIEGR